MPPFDNSSKQEHVSPKGIHLRLRTHQWIEIISYVSTERFFSGLLLMLNQLLKKNLSKICSPLNNNSFSTFWGRNWPIIRENGTYVYHSFKSDMKHRFLKGLQILTRGRKVDQFWFERYQKKRKDQGYKSV